MGCCRLQELDAEVSCLDISPISTEEMADFCAVGLWDISARIIKLSDMSEAHNESLGGGKTKFLLFRILTSVRGLQKLAY